MLAASSNFACSSAATGSTSPPKKVLTTVGGMGYKRCNDRRFSKDTYLLESVLASGHSYQLGGGFVGVRNLGVVDHLLLHNRLVLNVRGEVSAPDEVLVLREQARLSVGLTKHIFALHSGHVSAVAGDVLPRSLFLLSLLLL